LIVRTIGTVGTQCFINENSSTESKRRPTKCKAMVLYKRTVSKKPVAEKRISVIIFCGFERNLGH
jgi:hypothetical protein